MSADPSERSDGDLAQLCKERIAKEAAGLVQEGDTLFLNSSSTALLILKYLKGRQVTVITNNGKAMQIDIDP